MANLSGRDIRSTTGRNLALLRESSGLDPWMYGSARLEDELAKNQIVDVSPTDQWRVRYFADLIEHRQIFH